MSQLNVHREPFHLGDTTIRHQASGSLGSYSDPYTVSRRSNETQADYYSAYPVDYEQWELGFCLPFLYSHRLAQRWQAGGCPKNACWISELHEQSPVNVYRINALSRKYLW